MVQIDGARFDDRPGGGPGPACLLPWRRPPDPTEDPLYRGTRYLGLLRDLAVQPGWISLAHVADPPGAALGWIGAHIHQVNAALHAILLDMLGCFGPTQRPGVDILAAPIAPAAGVDGFYSDGQTPVILVDPGRIVAADWPGLVAHELAHAVVRSPGHGVAFRAAIAHLCLAHDLPVPPPDLGGDRLGAWPPCRSDSAPQRLWLGQGWPAAHSPGGGRPWGDNWDNNSGTITKTNLCRQDP
jgi:hypothetical protein